MNQKWRMVELFTNNSMQNDSIKQLKTDNRP
jgi:hypothetical protein